MRLSDFIRSNAVQIRETWDEFAATVPHGGKETDASSLRDHAGEILLVIAADLEQPQTKAEQRTKSRGEANRTNLLDTAAETHADTRIVAGFAIESMLNEYRALRASVLRMWAAAKGEETRTDELEQLMRFNEAIDQAITESVARYTEQVKHYNNLFMGMLGHDIRNPLGTIKMSTEVLVRSGQLPREAVQPIVNSAARIQSIVDLIVDFSQAQANGVMPIHPKPSDLRLMLDRVLAETQIRHADAALQLKASNTLEGFWDEGRLAQLLSNLLENAVSYGEPGQPVTVTVKDEGDDISLSVHNFGKPIAPDARETIFEPRKRGASTESQKAPHGLGLGLYISREIVRAHSGTLLVRSTPEEGTTFVARLPKVQAALQTLRIFPATQLPTRNGKPHVLTVIA